MKAAVRRPPLSRSQIMSRIKGRDTGPETVIRSALHAKGFRFRVSYRTPAGKVDIAFPAKLVAIQIDGCFWHSCPVHGVEPKTNKAFWVPKLMGNRERDRKQNELLRNHGWQTLRFWEHEVEANPARVVKAIAAVLKRAEIQGRKRR